MAKKSNTLENKVQLDILRYLRSQGCLFWRFNPVTYIPSLGLYQKHEYTPDGLPDIMCFHPGGHKEYKDPIFMGIEVKRPKGGRKGADQITMQRRFRLYNCEYVFVRSVQEVKDLGL